MKTGCSFSLIKPILQFYLADFCGFHVVTHYFSHGCKISTGFQGHTHTEKTILSSFTAATGIISCSGFLYLETCLLQTLKKKKKVFYSSKNMVAPSLWLQSCLQCLTQKSPEKYLNLYITVSAFRHSSPVLRLLLAMIVEASASGSNYISLSPSSASGHEVFLVRLWMRLFVVLSFFGITSWRAKKKNSSEQLPKWSLSEKRNIQWVTSSET